MPRVAATNRFRIRDFVSSLNFTGSTDKVNLGTDFIGTGDITVTGWLNPRTLGGSSTGRIIDNGRFILDIRGGPRLGLRSEAVTAAQSGLATALVFNVWQHFSATRTSAGLVNFKINDVASGGANQSSGTPVAATTNLTIANQAADSRQFDGKIDALLIFNRILTASELSAIYLQGKNPDDYATSCIYDGRMNEGAGTSVTDFSPGAHTGTITGATFSADVPMKARKQINGNKVKNGDFEYAPPFTAATTTAGRWIDGTSGGAASNNLFGWAIPTAGITAGASARFDPTLSRSGSGSILLSTTDATGVISVTNAISGSSPSILTDAIYPLSPNTTYILTAYVQTVNAATNSVYCDFREFSYNGSTTGTTATTSTNKVSGTNSTWTLLTVTVTTASNTRFGQVLLRNLVAGNISSANFDDISITPVYPEGRVPANGNLVKNFNFEVAPTFVAATTTQGRFVDGTASGAITNATYKWKGQSGAGATAVQFDPTVSHSGTYSMKLSALDVTGSFYVDVGAGIASSEPVATLQLYAIPIIGLTSYTLTGWVKTNNVPTNGAFLQLATYGIDGTRINNVGSSVKLTGTNDWTQITITTTVGSAAVWATVGLMKNVAGNISDAWFDDIYLAPTTNPGRVPIT